MSKVFIINKSSHDFSAAEKYGELVFMSGGPIQRLAVNSMARKFSGVLAHSVPEDYLLPSGLSIMNAVACAIFAHKHGRLNLLLFKDGRYYERNIILEDRHEENERSAEEGTG